MGKTLAFFIIKPEYERKFLTLLKRVMVSENTRAPSLHYRFNIFKIMMTLKNLIMMSKCMYGDKGVSDLHLKKRRRKSA